MFSTGPPNRLEGANLKKARKIILLSGIAVVTAAIAILLFALPGSRDHKVLLLVTHVERSSGVVAGKMSGGRNVQSVRTEAPAAIANHIDIVVAYYRSYPPKKSQDRDVTVAQVWLELDSTVWRTNSWAKAKNRVFQYFHGPIEVEGRMIDKRLLSESEKIFLRVSPNGWLYISTAEDREHKIADYLKDDSALEKGVTQVCLDRWSNWINSADSLTKQTSSPGKQPAR